MQAIYDAFVRIWQRDGWERLTTRNVALETGIAVDTLHGYFSNKTALLSGYARHCIEAFIAAIDRAAVQPPGLSWLHAGMLALQEQMAKTRRQRRAHEELAAAWDRVLAACTDLPHPPGPELRQALHLSA